MSAAPRAWAWAWAARQARSGPTLPTPHAYYPFDQTAGPKITDASGHGLDGTAVGTVAFGSGIIGNDLSLRGTAGNYVTLPGGLVQSLTDATIAFWVFVRNDATANTWQRVFDFGTGTTANMFFTPHASNGTARFAITTAGSANEQRLNHTGPLPVGVWTHVAIVFSADGATLYVNSLASGEPPSPAPGGYRRDDRQLDWPVAVLRNRTSTATSTIFASSRARSRPPR